MLSYRPHVTAYNGHSTLVQAMKAEFVSLVLHREATVYFKSSLNPRLDWKLECIGQSYKVGLQDFADGQMDQTIPASLVDRKSFSIKKTSRALRLTTQKTYRETIGS